MCDFQQFNFDCVLIIKLNKVIFPPVCNVSSLTQAVTFYLYLDFNGINFYSSSVPNQESDEIKWLKKPMCA